MASKQVGRQSLIGLRVLKTKYELVPLVTFLGMACTGAVAYIFYSLWQKPDVRLNKSTALPPWERVNPEQPQKLLTFNTKYQKIPELEELRKEIGSYKT